MSLTIELTPQEEARFADYARQRGLEPATLAKTLITAPLPPVVADEGLGAFGGKSVADLMAEIGFAEGLPPDLSTNPVYMKDFGKDAGESQS
jgi:hypothetical protein